MHIIHVGNMGNKGTQALLVSDISIVREVIGGDVAFSVSTTNVEGVKELDSRFRLLLEAVVPPMVDVPYEKADLQAKKHGFSRDGLKYKVFAVFYLFYMFVQVFLCAFSAFLARFGVKVFYRSKSLACMKACDVVVSCSDENFKEISSLLPWNVYWVVTWWSMLISRTMEILVAKSLGKQVVMFPNSVGPFTTFVGRFLSKFALNSCTCVIVREPISYGILKSLGVKSPVILASDTTLLFDSQKCFSKDVSFGAGKFLGVSPGVYSQSLSREKFQEYILAHAEALDTAVAKYGFSVVFLPHYVSGFSNDDLEVSRLIYSRMKRTGQAFIVEAESAGEFKSLLSQMDIVLSSKMHPTVFAASSYIPVLCIAYDHKQTGFFESLGLSECVIPFGNVSCEALSSKIDYVWANREKIKAILEKRVPELKANVRRSIEVVIAPFAERAYSKIPVRKPVVKEIS